MPHFPTKSFGEARAREAKDAGQADIWDHLDSIPQEDEPVFFTD